MIDKVLQYKILESQMEADEVLFELETMSDLDILNYALKQTGVIWEELLEDDKLRIMEYLNDRFN